MTWTAPAATVDETRLDALLAGPERPLLAAYLGWQRESVLAACAGLTAEQLVTPAVPPSTLTLLGLVRHLAKVERTWWRIRLEGENVAPLHPPGTDDDFDRLDPARAAEEFEVLRTEWRVAEAVAARRSLDDEFETHGETWSVRMLHLHLIGEYAQHRGHLDLLRDRVLAAS